MNNLRIISDNAIDRASLTASSTAGALAVTNLQTDKKSKVWQSVGTSPRLTATWPTPEAIQAVAAPFCNWSPTATWRIRLTNEAQATNLQTYSEAGDGWSAAGTSAPTVTNAVTFGGVQCAKIDFTPGMSPGYSACRAERTGRIASVSAGVSYVGSAFLALSRALIGSETISINLNGVSATPYFVINATNSAAFVGALTRLQIPASTSVGSGSNYFVVVLSSLIASSLSVHTSLLQVETNAMSSYYPTTSAAAIRPLGYIDAWQTYSYDSGVVLACPAPAVSLRGWTAAQSASAYAYGGGSCARFWLPSSVSAYGMAIDIVDTNNAQGYLEAARLVCGPYWEPTYNTKTLAPSNIDSTVIAYSDAGDAIVQAGTIRRKIPIEFEYLPASDRTILANMLRNSRAYPIFLSVFPGNTDLSLERDNTVYGHRASDSEVETQAAILYGTKIDVVSI